MAVIRRSGPASAMGVAFCVLTVTVAGAPAGERDAIERRVHELLNPFVMRHDVLWE